MMEVRMFLHQRVFVWLVQRYMLLQNVAPKLGAKVHTHLNWPPS